MTNQNEAIELLLANRLYIYELFHALFRTAINEELLHILTDEHTYEAFKLLSEAENDKLWQGAEWLLKLKHASQKDTLLAELKDEYNRLFIGPEPMAAYPWESTYTGEKALFQESTLRVRQMYRAYGYLPQEYPRVADDHIALELHFMAKLSERTASAFMKGDKEEMQHLIAGQQQFLNEHMLKWIPSFAGYLTVGLEPSARKELGLIEEQYQAACVLIRQWNCQYYPVLLQLCADFIKLDAELMEELAVIYTK